MSTSKYSEHNGKSNITFDKKQFINNNFFLFYFQLIFMLPLLLFIFCQTRTEKKCLLETVPSGAPVPRVWKGCGGVLNASSTAKTHRVAFHFGTICLGFTGSHKHRPAMLLLAECIVPNVRDPKVIPGRKKKKGVPF